MTPPDYLVFPLLGCLGMSACAFDVLQSHKLPEFLFFLECVVAFFFASNVVRFDYVVDKYLTVGGRAGAYFL